MMKVIGKHQNLDRRRSLIRGPGAIHLKFNRLIKPAVRLDSYSEFFHTGYHHHIGLIEAVRRNRT